MSLPSFNTLSALLVASEVALAVTKRSKSRATGNDRRTLPLLWTVIGLSIFAGLLLREALPEGRLRHPRTFYIIGLILFIVGLGIRWTAIIQLGRFFTINVAIAEDHELITAGLYGYVRHPSYTGTLLIFLGFGLCMLNIFSLAALFLPISTAFLWRMHVEEEALYQAFGRAYEAYAARTSRILPLIW
ncbi:MAG TPA: isoprenylcysteine carboxylmethyltransferase family protein [Chthoniobacterales bacterium]|jgi:protein-S-isoprenylcysteine O-methyltransferase|nr:isoprenylcysteine carboxylmethyltransferase family protein [Chthoniobacterales bacterium]